MGSSVDGGVLDRGDLLLQCVLGRDKLIHAYQAILEKWIDEKLFLPSNKCCSRSTCAANKVLVIRGLKLFQFEDDSETEDDSLPFLDAWDAEFNSQLCEWCLVSMKLAYNSACQWLWSQLPGFFGLQPWDELKDFDM